MGSRTEQSRVPLRNKGLHKLGHWLTTFSSEGGKNASRLPRNAYQLVSNNVYRDRKVVMMRGHA